MSSVGGWKVEARRFWGSRGSASSTVTGTPASARQLAATRPTGPAPAIKTRSRAFMPRLWGCEVSRAGYGRVVRDGLAGERLPLRDGGVVLACPTRRRAAGRGLTSGALGL